MSRNTYAVLSCEIEKIKGTKCATFCILDFFYFAKNVLRGMNKLRGVDEAKVKLKDQHMH